MTTTKPPVLTNEEIATIYQKWDQTSGTSYAGLCRAIEQAVLERAGADAVRYQWLRSQGIVLDGHDFISFDEIADHRIDDAIRALKVTPAAAVADIPEGWTQPPKTVSDLIGNLRTTPDLSMQIYTAHHVIRQDVPSVCKVMRASISRERVVDGKTIDSTRTDVPYSLVLWAHPQAGQLSGNAEQVADAQSVRDDTHDFKNFHRSLCERFGYTHDGIDWRRDQVSLIEHIASQVQQSGNAVELGDHECIHVSEIGNYYDGLRLKREQGVDYWSIKNFNGGNWYVCDPADANAIRAAIAASKGANHD